MERAAEAQFFLEMKRATKTQMEKPSDVSSDDSSDSDSEEDAATNGNKFGLPNSAKGSRSDGMWP